eukprot:630369-Rhodomonas_salina.1
MRRREERRVGKEGQGKGNEEEDGEEDEEEIGKDEGKEAGKEEEEEEEEGQCLAEAAEVGVARELLHEGGAGLRRHVHAPELVVVEHLRCRASDMRGREQAAGRRRSHEIDPERLSRKVEAIQ